MNKEQLQHKIQELEQRLTVIAENYGLTLHELILKAQNEPPLSDEFGFVRWALYTIQRTEAMLKVL